MNETNQDVPQKGSDTHISIDDVQKVVIKIGTVESAEFVPDSDKLIRLTVNVGEETSRTIVAGIRSVVDNPQTLVGTQMPFIVNLAPRALRGIESNGMVLVASDETGLALLHPERLVTSGASVR